MRLSYLVILSQATFKFNNALQRKTDLTNEAPV